MITFSWTFDVIIWLDDNIIIIVRLNYKHWCDPLARTWSSGWEQIFSIEHTGNAYLLRNPRHCDTYPGVTFHNVPDPDSIIFSSMSAGLAFFPSHWYCICGHCCHQVCSIFKSWFSSVYVRQRSQRMKLGLLPDPNLHMSRAVGPDPDLQHC